MFGYFLTVLRKTDSIWLDSTLVIGQDVIGSCVKYGLRYGGEKSVE